jgi:hypothetical protein
MDEPREHFLAGAGLADDEHAAIGARHATSQVHGQPRRCVYGDGRQAFAQI